MKHLLVQVYRGDIEIISFPRTEEVRDFAVTILGKSDKIPMHCFVDPTMSDFCYSEFVQWRLNEKLKNGYVVVGVDGDTDQWLVTKRENTIP